MALDYISRIERLRKELPDYDSDLDSAVLYVESDPIASLHKCRLCLERLIKELYNRYVGREPTQTGDPLSEPILHRTVGKPRLARLRYARELANNAAHINPDPSTPADAEEALEALAEVLEWWRTLNPRSGPARRPSRPSLHDTSAADGDVPTPRPPVVEPTRPPRPPRLRRSIILVGGALALLFLGWWALGTGAQTILTGAVSSVTQSPALPTLPEPVPDERPHAQTAQPTKAVMLGAKTPPNAPPAELPIPAPIAGPDDATWRPQASHVSVDLYAVESDAAGQVYATGAEGVILVTGDGGRKWRSVVTGTKAKLFALAKKSDGRVFAAGTQGTLLLPSSADPDGYPRFRPRPLPQAHFADLWAACGHTTGDLFVGGDQGVLLQLTADGSVRPQPEHKGLRLRAIVQADERTLFAVGDSGTVLRGELRNTLATWQPVQTLDAGDLWGLLPLGQKLLIAGDYQRDVGGKRIKEGLVLIGTYPQGWQRSRTPIGTNPVYSLVGLSGDMVLGAAYVGTQPYLLLSLDGGASWQKQAGNELPGKLPIGKYAIGKSPLGDLFIVGPKGMILHKRLPSPGTSRGSPQ